MRWAQAVKEWNSIQFFKEDLYGIPKKGGEYYDDVKAIMEGSKYKKDVEKMMGKSNEPPKIDTPSAAGPKLEENQMEAVRKVKPILLSKQTKAEPENVKPRKVNPEEELPKRTFVEIRYKDVTNKKTDVTESVPLKEWEYYEVMPYPDDFREPFIFLVAKGKFDSEGYLQVYLVPRKGTRKFNPSTGNRAAIMELGNFKSWKEQRPENPEIREWLEKNVPRETSAKEAQRAGLIKKNYAEKKN